MYTIYRVENSKGEGCYQSYSGIHDWICDRHRGGAEHHPTPIFDILITRDVEEHEICGFELTQVQVKEITVYGDTQVLAIR